MVLLDFCPPLVMARLADLRYNYGNAAFLLPTKKVSNDFFIESRGGLDWKD
jgi:hypothetical protein